MKDIYFHHDSERGVLMTFAWFIEVGEFAPSLRQEDKVCLESEVADVFTWLCSICNLLNIDLDKAVMTKYNGKCPRCGKNPCICDGSSFKSKLQVLL